MPVALEVRHCRALIAVAEAGSIARAAVALGVAQSTLSETLISLERAVGARMVMRKPGVEAHLTSAARVLLPSAHQIVAATQAAAAMVAAEATILRVGAVESISSHFLPSAIRVLRSTCPEARVHVTVGLCSDLRSQVRSGRLELALLLGGIENPPEKDLSVRRLGTNRMRLLVKGDSPLARRRIQPAELGRLRILVPDPHGPLNDLLHGWLKGFGVTGTVVSAGSLEAVKQGVLADGAVGVLAAYAVDHEIATGVFAEVDIEARLPALALEAVTVSTSACSMSFDALIEALSFMISEKSRGVCRDASSNSNGTMRPALTRPIMRIETRGSPS
jgi:DNA-binding transcriptional LysR family regulator